MEGGREEGEGGGGREEGEGGRERDGVRERGGICCVQEMFCILMRNRNYVVANLSLIRLLIVNVSLRSIFF